MATFLDITQDTSPTGDDYLLTYDNTTSANKRVKFSDVTKAILSKSVDANGWTLYDNGIWKEYKKTFSGTVTSLASGSTAAMFTAQAIPAALSNLAGTFIDATIALNGSNAEKFEWGGIIMNGSTLATSTSLSAFVKNDMTVAFTVSYFLTVTIRI